jgi:hypothetical protein
MWVFGEEVLAINPKEIVKPVHIDTVIPKSPGVVTTDDRPGIFIVKIQAAPDPTSLHTFLFHLSRSDATQLQRALSIALQGTAN